MVLFMEINLFIIFDFYNKIFLLLKELIILKEFYVCNLNNMKF